MRHDHTVQIDLLFLPVPVAVVVEKHYGKKQDTDDRRLKVKEKIIA